MNDSTLAQRPIVSDVHVTLPGPRDELAAKSLRLLRLAEKLIPLAIAAAIFLVVMIGVYIGDLTGIKPVGIVISTVGTYGMLQGIRPLRHKIDHTAGRIVVLANGKWACAILGRVCQQTEAMRRDRFEVQIIDISSQLVSVRVAQTARIENVPITASSLELTDGAAYIRFTSPEFIGPSLDMDDLPLEEVIATFTYGSEFVVGVPSDDAIIRTAPPGTVRSAAEIRNDLSISDYDC